MQTFPGRTSRFGSRRTFYLAWILTGAVLFLPSCLYTRHTVGDGPRGGEVRIYRTYYAFWGLVTINGLDSRDLVGPADHYRIISGFRFTDCFLNFFISPLGLLRRTTRIEK